MPPPPDLADNLPPSPAPAGPRPSTPLELYLAEVLARVEAATRGPWAIYRERRNGSDDIQGIGTVEHHGQLQGPMPVITDACGIDLDNNCAGYSCVAISEEDAAFVVAARTDTPRLAGLLRFAIGYLNRYADQDEEIRAFLSLEVRP